MNKAKSQEKNTKNTNSYSKIYKQNINMEKLKAIEIKKSFRKLLPKNVLEIELDLFLNFFDENNNNKKDKDKDIILINKIIDEIEKLKKSGKFRNREKRTLSRKKDIEIKTSQNDNDQDFSNEKPKNKKKKKFNTSICLNEENVKDMQISNRNNFNKTENDLDYSDQNNEKEKLQKKKKRDRSKSKKKVKKLNNDKSDNGNGNDNDNSNDNSNSDIGNENVERNKVNFLNALRGITKNMLLESKIKGENVECIVESEVIPDLNSLLNSKSFKKKEEEKEEYKKQRINIDNTIEINEEIINNNVNVNNFSKEILNSNYSNDISVKKPIPIESVNNIEKDSKVNTLLKTTQDKTRDFDNKKAKNILESEKDSDNINIKDNKDVFIKNQTIKNEKINEHDIQFQKNNENINVDVNNQINPNENVSQNANANDNANDNLKEKIKSIKKNKDSFCKCLIF